MQFSLITHCILNILEPAHGKKVLITAHVERALNDPKFSDTQV